MDKQALVLHLRFNAWASKRVLESVPPEAMEKDLGNSKLNGSGGLYGVLSHIYQADSIWLDRLMGKSTADLSVYDAPVDHSALAAKWMAVHDRYLAWAQTAEWDRVVAYKNIKGEPFQSPVWQIVLHIVNHASYHRGQITTMLRQLGHTPVPTDLIAFYRSEAAHA